MFDEKELIRRAKEAVNPRRLSPTMEVGDVGSALLTDKGNIYTGFLSTPPAAWDSALSTMPSANRESRIAVIVAVDWDGRIVAPCGRCRELICQVDEGMPKLSSSSKTTEQ